MGPLNPHPEPLPRKGRGKLLGFPLPRRLGDKLKVRGPIVGVSIVLLLTACASPREKAFKAALKDYQRASQAAASFADKQVNQLTSAMRAFRDASGRWPLTVQELVQFSVETKTAFDPLAFNDVTFAALPDGSLQVHYDVDCSRFATDQYTFNHSGSVNVKMK